MSEKPRHLNMLREVHLPKELKKAKDAFGRAGLPFETFARGNGLEPWLKLKLPEGDVFVAYQYKRVVSTEKIPGFKCSTAGLGEFEYYVDIHETTSPEESENRSEETHDSEPPETPEPPQKKKIRVQ